MCLEFGTTVLGSILRAGIGMMDSTLWRLPAFDCSSKRGQRETGIDTSTDGIADHAPRPGVEHGREIDKASRDGDVGDVGDPELIGHCRHNVLGNVGKDRTLVIAVGDGDKTPARPNGYQGLI
jgi:hypothetical protein